MRVVVFVKADADSEAGVMPPNELLEAMGKYNEELVDAGIMLGGDGLKPSVAAKRVAFDGASRMVIDGPFAETKEQLLGFYVVDFPDIDAAIAAARELHRANLTAVYEIRPVRLYLPGAPLESGGQDQAVPP